MAEERAQPLIEHPETFVLGESSEELFVNSREENQIAALRLAQQAKHSLYIVSRDLDPCIYSNRDFATALTDLARYSRHSEIRILIQDNTAILRDGHRLVELSQRFPTYIKIRKLHPDYAHYNHAFLIADERGVVLRPKADLYEGNVYFNHPNLARDLRAEFISMWEPSQPDPNLRRLSL